MHDLKITGAHVIDPANRRDEILDVAIVNGCIAEVARDLRSPATQQIDAKGKLLVAGLIDVHCHVFGPGEPLAVDPVCGVGAGVTTVLDAGSATSAQLESCIENVIEPTHADVYALLTNHSWPDGYAERTESAPLDSVGLANAMERHGNFVKGVKVALTPSIVEAYGLSALEAALGVCEQFGTTVMLHVGDIGNPLVPATDSAITSDALDLLRAGDVMTHIYTPLTGGPLDQSQALLPAIKRARDRGVIMDAAKGDYGFGWAAAEIIMREGINPDTISSDIELYSFGEASGGLMVKDRRASGNRVRSETSLLEYLAFFLALGFSVYEVIEMVTSKAAAAMGLETVAGALTVGQAADVALLELLHGEYALTDVVGETRIGDSALVPFLTLKAGNIFAPSEGPHSWGFEPPRAA